MAADTGALATAKYDGLLAPAVLHRFWAMAMQDVVDDLRRNLGRLAVGSDPVQSS